MKHIIFLDPLEKLNIKKDSTLLFAASLKAKGHDVYFLFEQDFFVVNKKEIIWKLYSFSFEADALGFVQKLSLTEPATLKVLGSDIIHMRIDPPLDTRYMRFCWMLQMVKNMTGASITNDPSAILRFNEKIYSYEKTPAIMSFVGASESAFLDYALKMKEEGHRELVLKPLDLFQGIGVEKVSLDGNEKEAFRKKVTDYSGAIVAQPFLKEIKEGEVRTTYFKGVEIGSILKVPKPGDFISNIANGASFDFYETTKKQKEVCKSISIDLMKYGVDWIAFDILGDYVQEVNITCPGLLVEVSKACSKNLANDIIELI